MYHQKAERLQQVQHHLCTALEGMKKELAVSGDHKTAAEVSELIEKQAVQGVHAAFCGHFSAGKSTLINKLLEDPVLPTSPIPTSANRVTLAYGQPRAEVFLHSEKASRLSVSPAVEKALPGRFSEEASVLSGPSADLPVQTEKEVFHGQQAFSRMAERLTNSGEVKSIRLFTPSPLLKGGLRLIDTPGIDANETAHHLATMSALHLADVVFYVMDYNHVQSEVNLHFVKMIYEQGKPIFLVVNQIDKHLSWELSFPAFQQKVENTFADWGIQPRGFFYISLKQPDHPQNEWKRLCGVLDGLPRRDKPLRTGSTLLAARQLAAKHRQFLEAQQKPEREAAENVLREPNAEAILQNREALQAQLFRLREMPEAMLAAGREELIRLLDNAPITPYEVREKGRLYLQAREKAAQAGRWKAKRLKEAEGEALSLFFQAFREQVESHLSWHLKAFLAEFPERFQLQDEAWQQQAYGMEVTLSEALLAKTVKEGALSEAYVLNYMQDVTQAVKSLYRREALQLLEMAVQQLQGKQARGLAHLEQEHQKAEELWRATEKRQQLEEELQRAEGAMLQPFEEILPLEEVLAMQEEALAQLDRQMDLPERQSVRDQPAAFSNAPSWVAQKSADTMNAGTMNTRAANGTQTINARMQATVELLEGCAERMGPLPGLQAWAESVKARAHRLFQRRFTIALFGAFSAGKSSFANALLGDRVLPVSPHPTTAAINQILPPDPDHPHGHVGIRMKSREHMEADFRDSLAAIAPLEDWFSPALVGVAPASGTASDAASDAGEESVGQGMFDDRGILDERWMEVVAQHLAGLDKASLRPANRPHEAFLRAVVKGGREMCDLLGQTLAVDLAAFQEYVAVEEKACFVEQVRLYYDCPLTSRGITLVDTPGADSINARHTDVAFQYMKEADAVLFLTYYNHAFSRADREFLIQMGRVKSAFEMDKMFFILNAADLAGSREELDGVLKHLHEELGCYGISGPRLFPVSSQLALLAGRQEIGRLSAEEDALLRPLVTAVRRSQGQVKAQFNDPPDSSRSSAFALSGMAAFEEAFFQFVFEDLTQLAVVNACAELERGLEQLNQMIQVAQTDAAVREARLQRMKAEQSEVQKVIASFQTDAALHALEQEAGELFYYVHQRLLMRCPDFYQEAFAMVEDRGRETGRLLEQALQELLHDMVREMEQEVRVTSLRIERFVEREVKHAAEILQAQIKGLDSHYLLSDPLEPEFPDMQIHPAAEWLEISRFRSCLSVYKNARQFYENGGAAAMREAIQQALQQPLQDYLTLHLEEWGAVYRSLMERALSSLKERELSDVERYFQGLVEALADPGQLETWLSIRDEVSAALEGKQEHG